jgi:hypothetical protein
MRNKEATADWENAALLNLGYLKEWKKRNKRARRFLGAESILELFLPTLYAELM